jgi:flagellar motor protein MotB
MVAARMMGQLEPGMTNRLAGLGDEASAVGPALMVRTGEDLVTLTIMGVDDNVAVAKRIIDTMRPRMGESAKAAAASTGQGANAGSAGASADDAARAGQMVGGLLAQLAKDNQTSERESKGHSSPASDGDRADTDASSHPPEELALGPATGPRIRVPLVAGLALIGATYEPGRGDYEPIETVNRVTSEAVSFTYSADLPEGNRLVVDRVIRQKDLKDAREYRPWYVHGDPPMFPGTTAVLVSSAVYTDLTTKGRAEFTRLFFDEDPLVSLAHRLGGGSGDDIQRQTAVLERVEPHALAFPVLLNDTPSELHAIHARGRFGDESVDYYVLDDPDNPLVLHVAGRVRGRLVRIAFPTPGTSRIEDTLKKEARVELHGIYFDFGRATIRPESEPVLRDIASALSRNPEWNIGIEGHTDNIGGRRTQPRAVAPARRCREAGTDRSVSREAVEDDNERLRCVATECDERHLVGPGAQPSRRARPAVSYQEEERGAVCPLIESRRSNNV